MRLRKKMNDRKEEKKTKYRRKGGKCRPDIDGMLFLYGFDDLVSAKTAL